MEFLAAINAAIQAKAPIVALPMEGHAPLCIRQKLLKGALKGVTIHKVEVIVRDAGNRALKITGSAGGATRTSCTIFAIDRRTAQAELGKWAAKEKAKADKKLMLGALATPAGKKAAKLAEMESEWTQDITLSEKRLAGMREDEKALLLPAKRRTWKGSHLSDLHAAERRETESKIAAHRAVSPRTIKVCATLRKRISRLRGVVDTYGRHTTLRNGRVVRAFLKSDQANLMIATVRSLVAAKEDFARVEPPLVAHPRFPEFAFCPLKRIAFAPALPFDAQEAQEDRRHRASQLRRLRLRIAQEAAVLAILQREAIAADAMEVIEPETANDGVPVPSPEVASVPVRKPRRPSAKQVEVLKIRSSSAFSYIQRYGEEASLQEFLRGYNESYRDAAFKEYSAAEIMFQPWGGELLTNPQRKLRRLAATAGGYAVSTMRYPMRGYEESERRGAVDHARTAAHYAFRAHPELREDDAIEEEAQLKQAA